MAPQALIRRSLVDFFRDLVRGAMRTHEVESSEPTEHYLVSLLERFAKPPPGWGSRPLALDYLESLQSTRADRCVKLKHVGDTALFLCGVFMEHLERQIVSTNYYASLGRIAYRQLASLAPTDTAARADVFAEIFPGDAQTVRIYTRWLRTRGPQDAQWLLRQGITPFDPGLKTRH